MKQFNFGVLFVLVASFLVLHAMAKGSEKKNGIDDEDALCPCSRILDPVCADNGKTYANKCLFRCAAKALEKRGEKITIVKQGEC